MISTNSTNQQNFESLGQNAPSWADELEQLAAMTGYNPETPSGKTRLQTTPTKPQVSSLETDSQEEVALLDTEDLAEAEQSSSKTKTPLWSNPLAKAGFVTALMGGAIGTVGIFLWSVNGNWNSQLAQQPKPPAPVASPAPTLDPQQAEVGRLKTVAALGSQAQTLRQNAKNPTVLPRSISTKARKLTSNVEAPDHPSQSVLYSSPQSYSSPVNSVPPSSLLTRPETTPASTASVNPQEAWRTAQALGSYGQTNDTNPVSKNATVQPSDDPQQARYDADATALMSGVATRAVRLVPGTIATATLKTPIIWAQDLKSSQQPQRFGLELTQPLRDADGMVALPTGTGMIARVETISGSGLVELSIEVMVVPTNHGNHIVSVPIGVVLIAGQNGNPLMAQNYINPRKQLFEKDIGIALMGALGQVGTLLNRAQNESTTTSPYLSSTSVTNGHTNILGGLLQGGFGALQNQVAQRQQQDAQAILNRPNIWYIPRDHPVQVFINSPFEVRL